MRQPLMKQYPAACKARAVQLAVEAAQAMAQPARDLGVHANTGPTWLGHYHRTERPEQEGHDIQLYDECKRWRQANTRCKEARALLTKAAASCAPPLPCRTPGSTSSKRHCGGAVCVGC